jgi:xanthine dehydrogenase YagR molybdenum-binding subunit
MRPPPRLAAKAPVRVVFDRHEELSVTGYRPAAEMKIALDRGLHRRVRRLSREYVSGW